MRRIVGQGAGLGQELSQSFSCALVDTCALIALTMKQLQRVRESIGLLPEDVAKRSGVHVRTIKELEAGDGRKVQSRVQRGISKALGVKPIEIFTSDGVTK